MGATAESAAEQVGRNGFGRAGSVSGPGRWFRSSATTTTSTTRCARPSRTLTGNELEDEDAQDVVDAAIYWWREDDGDLVDALVDALTNLADGGVIWLFTPKSGRPGHVEPSEIEDAAPTAGLHATSTISASQDWTGTRLATPRGGRR